VRGQLPGWGLVPGGRGVHVEGMVEGAVDKIRYKVRWIVETKDPWLGVSALLPNEGEAGIRRRLWRIWYRLCAK